MSLIGLKMDQFRQGRITDEVLICGFAAGYGASRQARLAPSLYNYCNPGYRTDGGLICGFAAAGYGAKQAGRAGHQEMKISS